ncbi:unnamed protein product [Protopolystoma xenopodis]|uniref:Uncharacterized protein n=1 Tax=Protopolystoma xenopodis TaxID=117903 RepID=A0A448X4Y7_9PLAT|nr:unnamed protein product [Protopolystoma xenopodis]
MTRLLPLLPPDSETHNPLFWVALGVLQLDEASLYSAGLALLEQNLVTLDQHGAFDQEVGQPLFSLSLGLAMNFIPISP